jgi:hypothetical protein
MIARRRRRNKKLKVGSAQNSNPKASLVGRRSAAQATSATWIDPPPHCVGLARSLGGCAPM